jgi:lysophospholipid acyltransferase
VRPFFLTPDGTKPTPLKRYYDIASWLTTQLILSFTVIPFIILYFSDAILVWTRLYFYGLVCVVASIAFFASPAKGYLIRDLKKRNKSVVSRAISHDSAGQPALGLPSDPARVIGEAVQDIASEISARKT